MPGGTYKTVELEFALSAMIKVKIFSSQLAIFHTKAELDDLDDQVNSFIKESDIKEVISTSDACTNGENGATIGVIRVLTYRQS